MHGNICINSILRSLFLNLSSKILWDLQTAIPKLIFLDDEIPEPEHNTKSLCSQHSENLWSDFCTHRQKCITDKERGVGKEFSQNSTLDFFLFSFFPSSLSNC